MELKGFVHNYAWGKVGESSLVARLSGEKIDPKKTYAELWMGTHPSGTCTLKENGKPFNVYIGENPKLMGKLETYWENNENLPFLFKVLSINTALSIQVHPDKDVAELLHNKHPTIYKDPNYKPELAIALTDFRALCGFRPIEELIDISVNVPELQTVVAPVLLSGFKKTESSEVLRRILMCILSASEELIAEAVQTLLKRLDAADEGVRQKYYYDLLKRLNADFPNDPGILVALFLNDVHLAPGEAIFLPAGLPHAYISGDCVECMACSDNVVRAGLTPKYKDVETLLKILNYKSFSPEGIKFEPEVISPFTTRYNPPVPDFGVSKVSVGVGETWLSPGHDSCQICLVTSGEGSLLGEEIPQTATSTSEKSSNSRKEWQLKFGTILFLPPYLRYLVSAKQKLEIFFAYPNPQNASPDVPLFVF